MDYRTALIWVLAGGLTPGLLFGLLYRPSRWWRWRTFDLHGMYFALTLTYAWQLYRILTVPAASRVSLGWGGRTCVGIAIGLVIDGFMWLRLIRFVVKEGLEDNPRESREEEPV